MVKAKVARQIMLTSDWYLCKITRLYFLVETSNADDEIRALLKLDVLIHILDTLQADPLMADAEKVWQLVINTYANNPHLVSNTKMPIYVAIGNLCLKAYSTREAAFQNREVSPSPTPEVILQLRHQREVAKAKKQARDAKIRQSDSQASSKDMSSRPDDSVEFSVKTATSGHLQQSKSSDPLTSSESDGATRDDPFWFVNELDDNQVGSSHETMNMEIDNMLAQEYSVGDVDTQVINWAKWDEWLAESNVL